MLALLLGWGQVNYMFYLKSDHEAEIISYIDLFSSVFVTPHKLTHPNDITLELYAGVRKTDIKGQCTKYFLPTVL